MYSDSALPLAERALIARIRDIAGTRSRAVVKGIGDDCALLRIPAGQEALVTTDFTLEDVHFRLAWHPPASVGHRCLARGLSDIAAMGGEPLAVFLSLAVPSKLPQKWVNQFLKGLLSLARRHGISLAGGDAAQSPAGVLADIVVLGSAPKGTAIRRSGAHPGDAVYVSGELGGAAAALMLMMQKPGRQLNPRDYPRHFFPEPRLRLGRAVREKGLASAMIDLSDGLSTDLAHICEESGVGAELDAEAIPRAAIGKPPVKVGLHFGLHGGDDYELLFTVPNDKHVPHRIVGIPITRIGRITRSRKMVLETKGIARELVPKGWEHFR